MRSDAMALIRPSPRDGSAPRVWRVVLVELSPYCRIALLSCKTHLIMPASTSDKFKMDPEKASYGGEVVVASLDDSASPVPVVASSRFRKLLAIMEGIGIEARGLERVQEHERVQVRFRWRTEISKSALTHYFRQSGGWARFGFGSV